MTSAIEICNLALTHLGCENILSFTQNNTIARKCALVYPQARDVALSGNSWGFAKKNETLALITAVTLPGYSYIYAYPAKCLKLVKVYNESSDETESKDKFTTGFQGGQRVIMCNVESAYAEYVAQIEDTTLYSPQFINALSYTLASMLCQALTGDDKRGVTLMQVANSFRDNAEWLDAVQQVEDQGTSSSYLSAR
jgi:hypothetical protein